jgi:glycosyltransferase involved in cell wall biosynthesis
MFTEVDHAKAQYHYRRSSYQGLPIYEVVHNHIYRRFEDTYADARMDRVFSRVLDEVRPDVVHLQHLLNHSLGYIAIAKQRGIPVVFTLHDYWLSCFNGGQRIQPDLSVCDEVDVARCADCARKFGGGAYLASKVASKVLGIGPRGGRSLLDRFASARVDAPRNFVRLDQLNLGGEPRPVLIAHPPARVDFPLETPAGTRLEFAVAMAPSTFAKPGGGVTFEIHSPSGVLWSRSLDPKARAEDRRWVEDGIALPAGRSGSLVLSLVTRSHPTDDNQHCTAGWAGLQLTEPAGAAQERLAPAKALFRRVERFLSTESDAKRAARVERRLARVREACHGVDLFLAPSPFLRRKLIEFGLPADKVIESDYGMRSDLLQPFRRKPSDVVRFGYVGSLVPHKGVHLLVEAFRRVAANGAAGRAVLRVHGNPSWYPDYTGKLRAAAAGAPIEFLGEFDNQAAAEIFAGLDVLVVPSVWWENAPITIHEAILTGTPVIASNLGGMADFVRHGENGLLFEAGNAADLARQLDWVVEDPSRLDALRRPAVPIKTMAQDAADMERRYLELLGAPSVSGRAGGPAEGKQVS